MKGNLAVTKALLQSGVTYVGGYQGAPVSHLLDVLADAESPRRAGRPLRSLRQRGGRRALLGASINYPMRGAVTFKSTVGTNVATHALSNLSSAGVIGGTLDGGRGGLRRGGDHDPGAHPRVRVKSTCGCSTRSQPPALARMVEQGFVCPR